MIKKFTAILALACSMFFGGVTGAAPSEAADPEPEGGSVVVQKERGLLDWTQNYIESEGMAVAPVNVKGAQAKALARRGAIVDLQRNLLEFMGGVQVDARTTMDNFMADDRVRTEVSGIIKNVELLEGQWDGESYTIRGRIRIGQLRVVMANNNLLPVPAPKPVYGATPDVTIILEPDPAPAGKPEAPKKQKFTGLVIDVRHLPYVPAMTFQVFDASGRPVYGIDFVNQSSYLQSGLCAYYNNINYAKGEVHVASSPIVARAVKLSDGNVNIIISNADAAKVRASSPDFRRECKVIVVSK